MSRSTRQIIGIPGMRMIRPSPGEARTGGFVCPMA